MAMKINASAPILTLKGEPYKLDDNALTLGQVCAEALASDKTGGKMKLYTLSDKLFKGGEVEVDAADLAMIKRAVNDSPSYNNIINGQALLLLEDVK